MDIVLGLPKTFKKHAIGLVLGASLSNFPRYRMNLTKHVKLKRQVDLKLSSVEVAENTSVNKTIDKSPYNEIAHGLGAKQPTNLILIADHYNVSETASSLASLSHHMCTNYTNKSVIKLHERMPTISHGLMLRTR